MPHDQPASIGSDADHSVADLGHDERQEFVVAADTHHGKHRLPVPRWLFNFCGHVVAAVLGLSLGYVILHALRPAVFPLPW
jgi:hypothetical protein